MLSQLDPSFFIEVTAEGGIVIRNQTKRLNDGRVYIRADILSLSCVLYHITTKINLKWHSYSYGNPKPQTP